MNSLEIELTCFSKSPLSPLYPPSQRPYGPAAIEGYSLPLLKGGQEGFEKNVPTIVRPLIDNYFKKLNCYLPAVPHRKNDHEEKGNTP